MTVQVGRRGVLTFPKALRDAYDIEPGDVFTLLDLGGVFMLFPQPSGIDALADAIGADLRARGETVETMLGAVREEREKDGDGRVD